ncbi:MAG: S8 family serine peptidase [Chitinophagales bacterium]|nr:S8 family serine peptidase [Chitinophagales bacterium]MDW8428763.1 S8 family serine peptidase [Chitinophagales bacterium]
MKFYLWTLVLSFLPCDLIAQPTATVIEAKKKEPSNASISFEHQVLAALRKNSFNGYFPALIKFEEMLTADRRQDFQLHSGIHIVGYLHDKTYVAWVPDTARFEFLDDGVIRSVEPVPLELKLAPSLRQQTYPEHIIEDENSVRVNIIGFREADHSLILADLQRRTTQVRPYSARYNIFEAIVPNAFLKELANLPYVQYVEPAYPPVKPDNKEEVSINRAHVLNSGFLQSYDGSGVWIAINDDGAVSNHIDWQGRIDNSAVGNADEGNHGNHLAGTILGAGNLDPLTRGHAPGAQLKTYFAYQNYSPQYGAWFDIPNIYFNPGVTITSTAVSDLVCNGGYNSLAQMLDQQAWDYPLLIHVLSAGNAGKENCGPLPGFYNITGGHKTAKNCITVGSVNDSEKLDDLSSRGPAKDGRLKPELVASGADVYSTYGINDYKSLSGTSMACAAVTGILALLTQAYKEQNGQKLPPSALLKAALLNTADDMGWAGPDWKHGYGRINARRAMRLIKENRYMSGSVDHGQTQTFSLQVPAGVRQLRVLLYWHDAPALLGVSKDLVNDLQLQLQLPNGSMIDPWILDPTPVKDSLNKPAWRGIDTLNNHEQITINNPIENDTYTLIVTGSAVPLGPQSFYIVYEFLYDEITLTYPIGRESWKAMEKHIIRWDSYGLLKPLTLEISYDDGSSWQLLAVLDSFVRNYEFTVPQQVTGRCRIRVSRSDTSSTSDWFSIFPTPQGLSWQQICPLKARLTWNAVPGATHYEVFVLGPYEMQAVGTTTKNYFDFYGLNPNVTDWVAVRAYGPDSVFSARSVALQKPTGLLNCTITANVAATASSPGPYLYTSCMELQQTAISLTISNTAQIDFNGVTLSYQHNSNPIVTEYLASGIGAGSTLIYTFSSPADLSAAGTHTLRCWVSAPGDQNPWDDTLVHLITVADGAALTLPIKENFDLLTKCEVTNSCVEGICPLASPWLNLTNLVYDSIDWRVHSGSTPGEQTGPAADFNSADGTGKYIYLEAGSCKNKEAHLLLPCVDLSSAIQPRLAFARHQYGQGMGSLSIDIFTDGQWHENWFTTAGNLGNAWIADTLDLSAFCGHVISVRFRGKTGNSSTSDLALDAIRLYDAASIQAHIEHTNPVCTESPVTFYNMSEGQITFTQWTFAPDGIPPFASAPDSVLVLFPTPGLKIVSLTIGNEFDTLMLSKELEVREKPHAQFQIQPTQAGFFELINTSAGADSCLWFLGDGTFATTCTLTHQYETGTFTVMLLAINECGIDTAQASVVVTQANTGMSPPTAMVYPNPFTDKLVFATNDLTSAAALRIYSATGFLKHETVMNGERSIITTTRWPAGLYVAEVINQGWRTHILLIKHQ